MLTPSAIQNFNFTQPFLIRTKRYNLFPLLSQTELTYVFMKEHVFGFMNLGVRLPLHLAINQLFKHNIRRPFWLFLKGITDRKTGLISNNLSKSAAHWTLENTYRLFFGQRDHKLVCPNLVELLNARYFQPVVAIHYSFHKKHYNTLMFYWINLILASHPAGLRTYHLPYNFVLFPNHFYVLMFVNLFYFRIHHY